MNLSLRYALKGEDVSGVRRLLDEGASALGQEDEACGQYSQTHPLQNLAMWNKSSSSADMAQALLDHGALVNAQTGTFGSTPLHSSCMMSNVTLSRRLLVNGANPNLKNNNGWSAMHMACYYGPLELALLLVRFGANVYLADSFEHIPLDWCGKGDVVSRDIVETAFITREGRWRRRKHFVAFRAWIYGSGAFLAKQEKLLPAQRKESMKVQSTTPKAWKSVDKVLGNPDLCRYIMEYI